MPLGDQDRVLSQKAFEGMLSLLRQVADVLAKEPGRTYLVGGVVRGALLDQPSKDIDIVVVGDGLLLAKELADRLGGSFVALDEERRIGRVVIPQQGQNPWILDLATQRGATIEEDLAHRDFTIDAMAVGLGELLTKGSTFLHDPFGGRADLQRRSLRAVQEGVFAADGLRILRAFRLTAESCARLHPATEALVRRDQTFLSTVAHERLRDELSGVLFTPQAAATLREMDRLGVLSLVIPEIEEMRRVPQPKEHYWDVLQHALETVGAAEDLLEDLEGLFPELPIPQYLAEEISEGRPRWVLLKLGALLHDIAKPRTRGPDQTGRIRFLGHASLGAEMATKILEGLRFSAKEVRMVAQMVRYHLRPADLTTALPPTSRAVYRYFRDVAPVAVETALLHLADHRAARGPLLDGATWQQHLEGVRQLLRPFFEERTQVHPTPILDGHEVMAALGLAPGPLVGQLLEEVREAQAEGAIRTKEEALDFLRQHPATVGGSSP